jgi:hypothetical protein
MKPLATIDMHAIYRLDDLERGLPLPSGTLWLAHCSGELRTLAGMDDHTLVLGEDLLLWLNCCQSNQRSRNDSRPEDGDEVDLPF